MCKLLLVMGDLAAGKSTFADFSYQSDGELLEKIDGFMRG